MSNTAEMVAAINSLSDSELSKLAGKMEKTWGIKEAQKAVLLLRAPSITDTEEVVPDNYNVVLKVLGNSKVSVIKVLKEVKGIGLVDAKTLAETANAVVGQALPQPEAELLSEKLKAVGATIELEKLT